MIGDLREGSFVMQTEKGQNASCTIIMCLIHEKELVSFTSSLKSISVYGIYFGCPEHHLYHLWKLSLAPNLHLYQSPNWFALQIIPLKILRYPNQGLYVLLFWGFFCFYLLPLPFGPATDRCLLKGKKERGWGGEQRIWPHCNWQK